MRQEFYDRAHKAAEEHLRACQEAMDVMDEESDPEKWPETPSAGPFCGCDTCTIREALHAALPVIEEGVREELTGA